MKDAWDKWQSFATTASLLAVPIVLAWGGWLVQERIAEQSTKREYVQLALSILREAPNKENADAQSLRKWAISIVDRNAPQPLTEESRVALSTVSLPSLDGSGSGTFFHEGCSDDEIIIGGDAGQTNCLQRQLRARDSIIRNLLLREVDLHPQSNGKDDSSSGKPR
jgi:hypothetical protein